MHSTFIFSTFPGTLARTCCPSLLKIPEWCLVSLRMAIGSYPFVRACPNLLQTHLYKFLLSFSQTLILLNYTSVSPHLRQMSHFRIASPNDVHTSLTSPGRLCETPALSLLLSVIDKRPEIF